MRYLKSFNESFQYPTDEAEIRRLISEITPDGQNGWEYNNNLNDRMVIHRDGTVDIIEGGIVIDLSHTNESYKRLPVKFGYIQERIALWHLPNLTTLEGSPESCEDFHLNICIFLKSLVGGPKFVHGNYRISGTHITSLEGAPDTVGGTFDIEDCVLLTSLEGSPRQVGAIDISKTTIKDLKGGPEVVENVFRASLSRLTSLEGLPKKMRCLIFNPFRSHKGLIFDPRPFKGCQIEDMSCREQPFLEILHLFNPYDTDFNHSPFERKTEILKRFIDSLDYNYIRELEGEIVINLFRFKEALDEFDIENPLGELTTLEFYDFVDDEGRVVDFYGNPI